MHQTIDDPIELTISATKVGFLIVKSREFAVKVEPVDMDEASNAADDGERAILEDLPGDLTETELRDALENLDDDEAIDIIALVWIGRGDFDRDGWAEARALAFERHLGDIAGYLMGIPLFGDFLELGYGELGHSIDDVERERL